jgi:hypothetical protein
MTELPALYKDSGGDDLYEEDEDEEEMTKSAN